jgi:hypothetical protein
MFSAYSMKDKANAEFLIVHKVLKYLLARFLSSAH